MLFLHKFSYLTVNFLLCISRACKRSVTAKVLICYSLKGNHIKFITHTIACNHGTCKLCCLLNIIRSASSNLIENYFLSGTAACKGCDFIFNFFFCHQIFVTLLNLHSVAKSTRGTRDDRDFLNWCRVRLQCSYKCVTDFMVSNYLFLLIRENCIFLLITSNNNLNTFLKVSLMDNSSSLTYSAKSSFIYYICKLSTGSTRCHSCNCMKVNIICRLDFLCMNFKDCFTSL